MLHRLPTVDVSHVDFVASSAPARRLWARPLLLLPVALSLHSCGSDAPVEVIAAPRAVTVVELAQTRPRTETRTTGVVEPYRRSDLGVDVSGLLTSIVDLGEDLRGPQYDEEGRILRDALGAVVQAGDVVATIDPTRYAEAVDAAQLAIESTLSTRRARELELERVLEPRLESARASRASSEASIDTARDSVAVAQSELELAQSTVERDRVLIASGAVAQSVLDSSEAEFRTASARLDQARSELQIALQSERSALAALDESEGNLVVQRAEIASLDAQLAELRNELRRARTDLESCTLRAPFSGRVTALHSSIGSYVTPGTALVELTLQSPLMVVLTASAEQERGLPVGAGLPVYLDQDADPAAARVATVYEKSSVADSGTRTYRIGLLVVNELVDGTDAAVRTTGLQGFFPTVTIPGDPTGTLFVNVDSLVREGGRTHVLRLPEFSTESRERELERVRVPERVELTLGERWEQIDTWTLRSVASGDLERGQPLLLDPESGDASGVRLGAPTYELRAGELVQVGLDVDLPPSGYWLPASAIADVSGQKRVFTVAEGRARALSVDVSDASGDLRRIESPDLRPGLQLVLDGVPFLRDGAEVSVTGVQGGGAQ